MQLERKGNTYIMSAARYGEPYTVTRGRGPRPRRRGLRPASSSARTTRRWWSGRSSATCASSGRPRTASSPIATTSAASWRSSTCRPATGRSSTARARPSKRPNWTPDGAALIYNTSGRVRGARPALAVRPRHPPAHAHRHGLRDTQQQRPRDLVRRHDARHQRPEHRTTGRSTIFTLPSRAARRSASPRCARPTCTAGRRTGSGSSTPGRPRATDEYDIYKIASDGSGTEIRLTDSRASTTGRSAAPTAGTIYFNSVRSGTMQLWRMKPDGRDPEQVTNDEYNNWFPHFSPDGRWIAFISLREGRRPLGPSVLQAGATSGSCPPRAGPPKVIAYVYGGQGTINVPSWSPDGTDARLREQFRSAVNEVTAIRLHARVAPLGAVALLFTLTTAGPSARAQAPGRPLYKDAARPVDERVRDLLARMTLEEKVAQTLGIWKGKEKITDEKGRVRPRGRARAHPERPRPARAARPSCATSRRRSCSGPRENAVFVNAVQKWLVENTRLGHPRHDPRGGAARPGAPRRGRTSPSRSRWPAPGIPRWSSG